MEQQEPPALVAHPFPQPQTGLIELRGHRQPIRVLPLETDRRREGQPEPGCGLKPSPSAICSDPPARRPAPPPPASAPGHRSARAPPPTRWPFPHPNSPPKRRDCSPAQFGRPLHRTDTVQGDHAAELGRAVRTGRAEVIGHRDRPPPLQPKYIPGDSCISRLNNAREGAHLVPTSSRSPDTTPTADTPRKEHRRDRQNRVSGRFVDRKRSATHPIGVHPGVDPPRPHHIARRLGPEIGGSKVERSGSGHG